MRCAGGAGQPSGCSFLHPPQVPTLARRVAEEIADYLRSGYTVEAVVGIGGSPSCGVRTTLDLPAALDTIAGCDPARLDRRDFNDQVIVAHARHGEGRLMAALRRQLRRRRLQIRLREYDLITEITKRSPAVGGSAPSGTEDDT